MEIVNRAKKRRRFFKLLAPVYDNCARLVLFGYYNHLRQEVREKIEINEGMRILDIASGTGYVAQILKPADVVCIDITMEMLDRARKKTDAKFVLADAHKLPFNNETFDAAISTFAMHEMAGQKRVFSEIFRVLKSGGDIVVMDVVQQKRLLNRIRYQIFHTWVDPKFDSFNKYKCP